jgi:glycine/D-amino acid oxidase-like deaminating enzyme/nitrite reductase/ring-hydroxylating ferredoxin subunit
LFVVRANPADPSASVRFFVANLYRPECLEPPPMPTTHESLAIPGVEESLWIADTGAPARQPLTKDIHVDVAIVGAGIVGLTLAYLLKDDDLDVAVLEKNRILEGVTGKTTAKVTTQHNVVYRPLADRFGREVARQYALANQEAQLEIARLIKKVGVDADYKKAPSFVYTRSQKHLKALKEEARLAADLELPASFTTQTELPFDVEGAVRFEDQAHFHPRKYLLALAREAERSGCRIYESSPALHVDDGRPCKVDTPAGRVTARYVVVATHVPITDKRYFVHRMRPRREYVIATPLRGGGLTGMYVNHEEPRRSIRPYEDDESGPMLIIAGEDHATGARGDQDHFARLVDFAQEHFEIAPVKYRWSTQDYYPFDGLAMVGTFSPGSKHVMTATGFAAWGMTQGTLAAIILAGEITGRQSAWRELYGPYGATRVMRDMVDPEMWKTGAHVVKEFVGQRIKKSTLEELRPGEAQVADIDGRKVAISRDEDGVLHKVSAKCTHMGCIVAYNQTERSWDCPCHGARFARDGRVLRGPSTRPLGLVD